MTERISCLVPPAFPRDAPAKMHSLHRTLQAQACKLHLKRTTPFLALLQAPRSFCRIPGTELRRLSIAMSGNGDLNNTQAGRAAKTLAVDHAYSHRDLSLHYDQDDTEIRHQYRPFLLDAAFSTDDWILQLELSTAIKMVQTEILDKGLDRIRVLVLYGSLRKRLVPLWMAGIVMRFLSLILAQTSVALTHHSQILLSSSGIRSRTNTVSPWL